MKTNTILKLAIPKVASKAPSIAIREAQARCRDFAVEGSTNGLILKRVTLDDICEVNVLSET